MGPPVVVGVGSHISFFWSVNAQSAPISRHTTGSLGPTAHRKEAEPSRGMIVAVKLRLMRMGKKKQPTYRVVAADSRSPRDGRFIEVLGFYNPRSEPSVIEIDNDKAVGWLKNGAQPTERVQKLLTVSGAWSEFTGQAPPTPFVVDAPAAPAAAAAVADDAGADDAAPATDDAPAAAADDASAEDAAPAADDDNAEDAAEATADAGEEE